MASNSEELVNSQSTLKKMSTFYIFIGYQQLLSHPVFKIICESGRRLWVLLITSVTPNVLSRSDQAIKEFVIFKLPCDKMLDLKEEELE